MIVFDYFAIAMALLVNDRDIPNQLPINKIQVIGSHNSYKQAIDPELFGVLAGMEPEAMQGLAYGHIPVVDQLEMGLRSLELDLYRDEKGGRYARPKGLDLAPGQGPYDPDGEMLKPGFKVMHVPDIDFRSDAYGLEELLGRLASWSMAHPQHAPIFITLEAKSEGLDRPGMTEAEEMTVASFAELDRCIAKHLGRERIITPDDVRGDYGTLEEAVLAGQWPTMGEARGKYLFVLDDRGKKRSSYMAGHPSLRGRMMFVNAEPGTPEAAFLIRNDAKLPEMESLVRQGYLIRTRADADTREARTNDRSSFEAACRSGAQVISTDYYLKSTYFESDYEVQFEGGTYIRPNPVFQ